MTQGRSALLLGGEGLCVLLLPRTNRQLSESIAQRLYPRHSIYSIVFSYSIEFTCHRKQCQALSEKIIHIFAS
jgi:hypothetical protein